jgi:hypothetical protein
MQVAVVVVEFLLQELVVQEVAELVLIQAQVEQELQTQVVVVEVGIALVEQAVQV